MRSKSIGFTLVEVLVISPIIILFIGTFILLLINLTGESLVVRERNALVHETQQSIDEIQARLAEATNFPAATGTLQTPQGRDNTTGLEFNTNVNTGQSDVLILSLAATDKRPNDPTRTLIYTGPMGTCDSKNPLYTYMAIYFVALDDETLGDTTDRALYKRTIMPTGANCKYAWQRGSCKVSVRTANPSSTICQMNDERLAGTISKFDVVYYAGGAVVAPSAATEVSVSIEVAKSVAGTSLVSTSSTRIKSLNIQK